MSVSNDDDFLSPYAENGKPVISSEVAEFLENAASAFHPSQPLALNVHGDCIDENERKAYPQAIKNYFSLQYRGVLRDMKRKTMIAAVFAIVGILALISMFVFSASGLGEVWVECIDIFAWVFLWEAVDQFFIERAGLQLRSRRLKNFTEMRVRFD